ncbi:MAG: cytochrome c oxidase accessory protein CcoG [Xanthomonadales bacterium]|nr:cytochrome c oxidase accessory protein CcoG [Xanthomonadales bacterium]MCB1635873.1 cytochrome c oxidase accessory protein CcoG [Xanthomonadales bacterium]
MYVKPPKIYPREISGRFQRLRTAAVFWLLGMFYVFPWLSWDGRQAVLFDLPARKFYVFGLVFWPQDFFLLAALLIIAALSLFFFTALAGRLWCGYACPQTVWTEVFLWLERLAEGRRNERMRLDKAPMSATKLRKKATKQFLWISFALWTGLTFVGFFTPIRDLVPRAFSFGLGGWEAFWTIFYGFATYGNAGFLREQVCKYMCPYARFQSAMLDRDSLIVTYDVGRGEPRGKGKRPARSERATLPISTLVEGAEAAVTEPRGASSALGDCIDCEACVQVCPTGIDIRDGLQYECIGCAACIDACDQVMDRLNYPRGLVRYSTQHAVDHERTRILRPRVLVYGSLLLALIGAVITVVVVRTPLGVDILHDRKTLYRERADGSLENVYQLKLVNKSESQRIFLISLDPEGPFELIGDGRVLVSAGGVANVPLTVRAPAGVDTGRERPSVTVVAEDDPQVSRTEHPAFLGPQDKR